MNRLLVLVLFALVVRAGSAGAQALEGEYGAACANLASNSLQVPLTQSIAANSMIVVTATIANNFAFNNTVSDPVGGTYATGGVAVGGLEAFVFFRYTTTPLPSGTLITYSMSGGSGSNACLTIAAFNEVTNTTSANANGANSSGANSSTQTATTSGGAFINPSLVYMGVGYATDPGALTPAVGTQLSKTCGGNAPVMCVAGSFYLANDLGPFAQTVNSANSVAWAAGISALPGAHIFINGFE